MPQMLDGQPMPELLARSRRPDELTKTVRQIQSYGRRGEAIHADIRDIKVLRTVAGQVERDHDKTDIVVADAAPQRWKPPSSQPRPYSRSGASGSASSVYRPMASNQSLSSMSSNA